MTSAAGAVGDAADRVVVLGRVNGAFGVAGWIKIESYTDPPERLLSYSEKWLWRRGSDSTTAGWTRLQLTGVRMSGRIAQAQLDGITTRERAAELRGSEIGLRRGDLPSLKPGEYYWDDLIGLEALTPDDEPLGEIVEIRTGPAHPLLRLVERPGGGGQSGQNATGRAVTGRRAIERWVPFVRERILSVDLAMGRAILNWRRDW